MSVTDDLTVAPGPVPLDDFDEPTLVARARDRDPRAFEVLVRRFQQRIYRLCLRMMDGASGEAEELTQETFLTAWRRLPEITSDDAFGAWLYRTATNRCLNALRRRPLTTEFDTTLEERTATGLAEGDPQRMTQHNAAMAALLGALRELTPHQRAAWLLRELHGRSYEEIAHIMDTTTTAVRGRIARARIELAKAMAPWR